MTTSLNSAGTRDKERLEVCADLTPHQLQIWLEWAGGKLLALPSSKIKPQEPYVAWPEYSQNKFEILDFRTKLAMRIVAPSTDQIPIMDLILTLPNVCERDYIRRVLHARCLVNPINGSYINSWQKIALKINSNRRMARYWHGVGLIEACEKVDEEKVCRIRYYFGKNFESANSA